MGDLYKFVGFVPSRDDFLERLKQAYREATQHEVGIIPATNVYNVVDNKRSGIIPNVFKLRDSGIDPFSIILGENGSSQKLTLYFCRGYMLDEDVKRIIASLSQLGLEEVKEEEEKTKELSDLLKELIPKT